MVNYTRLIKTIHTLINTPRCHTGRYNFNTHNNTTHNTISELIDNNTIRQFWDNSNLTPCTNSMMTQQTIKDDWSVQRPTHTNKTNKKRTTQRQDTSTARNTRSQSRKKRLNPRKQKTVTRHTVQNKKVEQPRVGQLLLTLEYTLQYLVSIFESGGDCITEVHRRIVIKMGRR